MNSVNYIYGELTEILSRGDDDYRPLTLKILARNTMRNKEWVGTQYQVNLYDPSKISDFKESGIQVGDNLKVELNTIWPDVSFLPDENYLYGTVWSEGEISALKSAKHYTLHHIACEYQGVIDVKGEGIMVMLRETTYTGFTDYRLKVSNELAARISCEKVKPGENLIVLGKNFFYDGNLSVDKVRVIKGKALHFYRVGCDLTDVMRSVPDMGNVSPEEMTSLKGVALVDSSEFDWFGEEEDEAFCNLVSNVGMTKLVQSKTVKRVASLKKHTLKDLDDEDVDVDDDKEFCDLVNTPLLSKVVQKKTVKMVTRIPDVSLDELDEDGYDDDYYDDEDDDDDYYDDDEDDEDDDYYDDDEDDEDDDYDDEDDEDDYDDDDYYDDDDFDEDDDEDDDQGDKVLPKVK
jgi:hypothetical protein